MDQDVAAEVDFRTLKKIEMASQVSDDLDEFIGYLMLIEDDDAIEEFFNACHGSDGKFCGGKTGKGPGGRVPRPIKYLKQRASTAANTAKGRGSSKEVKRVTTGAVRRGASLVTGVPFSTAYGSVKINKLSKTNLKNFTNKDLKTVRRQLTSDQRRYNHMDNMAMLGTIGLRIARPDPTVLVAGIAVAATMMGLASYKTKRIPGQIERIDREIEVRSSGGGGSLSAEVYEFASGSLPTLAQEIAAAKKRLESGDLPDVKKPSPETIIEIGKVIDALEVDEEEGITADIIKDLKAGFALVKPPKS